MPGRPPPPLQEDEKKNQTPCKKVQRISVFCMPQKAVNPSNKWRQLLACPSTCASCIEGSASASPFWRGHREFAMLENGATPVSEVRGRAALMGKGCVVSVLVLLLLRPSKHTRYPYSALRTMYISRPTSSIYMGKRKRDLPPAAPSLIDPCCICSGSFLCISDGLSPLQSSRHLPPLLARRLPRCRCT